MASNPYASRETQVDSLRADMQITAVPEYVIPQMGSYGAPPITEGSPYNDEFGWGPTLRTTAQEIPSAQRLKVIPDHDFRPDGNRPPEEFWRPIGAENVKRHTVEQVDADGWGELKGIHNTDRRWAPNPRSTPPPEPRPTTMMSPSSYSFTRPFDQHSARQFNGTHFSMADHRRNYEILGMSPARTMRNTYRIEPTPWDQDIVDLPPAGSVNAAMPEARLRGVEVAPTRRSWRLG